ncbi:hypothetical protein IQ254_24490 [Nodosilinea sp. LEGE 07088]|uniref:hypothetical protein n=1 Tax=Nodosilinea sp. LEGE 07088 TaxID=2777968 RepID=UPI001880B61C|nr:hypothetical protein [Nodosilinea sp. LEGE 07088]MBE9140318.1 hypothetical protein [Nodosilinea sp. LEGE 07088]
MEKSESHDSSNNFDNSLSKEAIQKLKRELIENPDKVVIQLGKYGVTIEQASDIHIGDIINNKSLDRDTVDTLVAAIRDANDATNGMIIKHLKRQPLETLSIDSEQIKKVNLDLEIINDLEKKGYLNEKQRYAFTDLKQEVNFLNEFDQRLKKLHSAAKVLLEEGKENLIKKIELLRIEGEKLLDPKVIEKILQEKDCKESELRIIENLIRELEESAGIAVWIDKNRKVLSKRYGHDALKAFPDIKNSVDAKKVSYFCFSIYQFLEQISHCLKWGRHDILDSPDIPLVFDYQVYETAFSLIKETIDKNLNERFDQASRKLANECIDYLISQLPFYEQE